VTMSTGALALDGTGAGTAFGGNVSFPSFSVTSDIRLKSNIIPLTGSADIIDRTNVYEFDKITGLSNPTPGEGGLSAPSGKTVRQWGVIAQEVQEIAPLLVSEREDGFLGVDMTGYVPHLIAEMRALRARVAVLEAAA